MSPNSPLTDAGLTALVDEARHAPSVHNIQPARWALLGPEVLALRSDPGRRLPIADPTGHDVRVSLGAAALGAKHTPLGTDTVALGAMIRS